MSDWKKGGAYVPLAVRRFPRVAGFDVRSADGGRKSV